VRHAPPRRVIEDADRASEIIARIRLLAKKAPVAKSLLDLGDVLKNVLALSHHESAVRRVTIRTDLPADLSPISGDAVQLQQVLLNLMINGMDAMNQVEETREYRTHRERSGAWHDAVRRQDGHGNLGHPGSAWCELGCKGGVESPSFSP
jgi:C4-dicarboxylate-specific signal transduction histidine kinase